MKRAGLLIAVGLLISLMVLQVYGASNVAWTILGESNVVEMLEQFDRMDGESISEVAEFGGQECRIVKRNDYDENGRYMYFKINDDFMFNIKNKTDVWLTIEYFDITDAALDEEAAVGIMLQYDSYNLKGVLMGAYTDTEEIAPYAGSGEWKTFTWHLTDAKFSNRQNDNCDFRLSTQKGNPVVLRKVAVSSVAPEDFDFAGLGN